MHRTNRLALALCVSAGALAIAQPEQGTGIDRRTQAQIDRVMKMDQDADGKLARDEMPARLAERIFGEADADTDGFVTREELTAYFVARSAERPGAGGQAEPGNSAEPGDSKDAAQPEPARSGGAGLEHFEGSMKKAGQALRELRRSSFGPDTRDSDLAGVQSIQEAMVAAKDAAGAVPMAPQARDTYGDDTQSYDRDMRLAFVRMLRATLDLEAAILESDADASRAALAGLLDSLKSAHGAFQEDDD